jgi:Tol biopolymer transport system component
MRIRVVVTALLLSLAGFVAQAQNGTDLFQQGLARETAGDLDGARRIFERIVRDFPSNRTLTARALLQRGRWSELIERERALGYYERLIREFGDQADQTGLVAQARVRVAALTQAPAPAVAPPVMTVRALPEVTSDGELLAVSPDGTKAVVMDYSNALSGGQNLAVYEFATGQKRLLTDIDWLTGWTYFGVWSPDSRRVAYSARYHQHERDQAEGPSSELRVVTLDGRSSLVYRAADPLTYMQPVDWTPDGATLVAVVRRSDGTWTLGTVPATGGSFTPLRSLGWSYDSNSASPKVSPDGRFIAFLDGEAGLRNVYVISLDGRELHRITDDPADDMSPVWSPDGGRIAFVSNRLGSAALWTVDVHDGRPAGPAVKLKDGMTLARLIDWTGRGIFYDQQSAAWDIYTVSMDPAEARATGAPRLLPYARTGRNVSPVWSPDGRRLAFVSSTATLPNRRYVAVMSADGGDSREFLIPTTNWEYINTPYDLRWFGDGRGLGFSGLDARGAPVAFRLRLDTGHWDTISLPETWRTSIEWNHDGSAVYSSEAIPPRVSSGSSNALRTATPSEPSTVPRPRS